MRNKIIIGLALLFSFGISYGQVITKKATLKKLHPAFSTGGRMMAAYNQKTSITFKFEEKEAFVVEFSGITITMNKVAVGDEKAPKKVKIETPKYEDKKVIAQDAVAFGRDVYLIARHEDKKTDKFTIIAYKIDLKNLSLNPQGKILDTYIDGKGEYYGYSYETINEKTLLVSRTITYRKEDYSKLYFLMFNSDMSKLWEHEVVTPGGKAYSVSDTYFKDENNMILTCIEYPDGPRKTKKKGKPNYKFHLFYYTNKMETVKDFELDLTDQFITDISVGINDNKQIIAQAFIQKKDFTP